MTESGGSIRSDTELRGLYAVVKDLAALQPSVGEIGERSLDGAQVRTKAHALVMRAVEATEAQ